MGSGCRPKMGILSESSEHQIRSWVGSRDVKLPKGTKQLRSIYQVLTWALTLTMVELGAFGLGSIPRPLLGLRS